MSTIKRIAICFSPRLRGAGGVAHRTGWIGLKLLNHHPHLASPASRGEKERNSAHRLIALLFIFLAPSAYAAPSVYIEDLTWMEIRDRIEAGSRIAIVPTGGTDQNGPHMVTGKHNIIVRYTAGDIARKLGDALVTPVIAYVPAGRIDPPEGHMQFPGTLSVSDRTFASLLEDTARSLKQHGFQLICFIGDQGGSQDIQEQVAGRLTEEWHNSGVRVLQVSDYYYRNGQEQWGESIGLKTPHPGAHAGLADTSELMALDPLGVRGGLRGAHSEHDYKTTGAMGDSSLASATLGRRFLSLKINAAVRQIRNAEKAAP